MNKKIKFSPSMMCANFLCMREELDIFATHNIDFLHIDIMDGHYVPNFTLGMDFCRQIKKYSDIPLDIHLMIDNVDDHIDAFCEFEGSWVSFHPETTWHAVRTIERIQSHGCKAGIAIDSGVSIEQFRDLYRLLDFVLIMTVTPGYAGQKLLPFCLEKITELKQLAEVFSYNFEIEVDGNVSWENIPLMIEAGASILVNGSSSIFDPCYPREEAIIKLKNMISKLSMK